MAKRPIFIPRVDGIVGVETKNIEFEWFPGFSVSQKKKSILSLHKSAEESGFFSVLEISSKSEEIIGQELSAFNLKIKTKKHEKIFSVECAFQGSKVFERGGPYVDLLKKSSLEAKKDIRIKNSGELIGFSFYGKNFPLEPKTLFYDWLYINALSQNLSLREKLGTYSAFTDIEFNPSKSINCQAYSAALYVSLCAACEYENAIQSVENFVEIAKPAYEITDSVNGNQQSLI